MKCPLDQAPLQRLTVTRPYLSDVHLDVCESCHGIWVDGGELAPLLSHFGSDHERTYTEWLQARSDGTTPPRDFWQESERTCPRDQTTMQRHYLGAAHQVGVDQCPTCGGFWFDCSELYAVAKANEPNAALDQAIAGVAASMHRELADNYDDRTVFWWDVMERPSTIVPHLRQALLSLMVAFLAGK